MSTGIDSSYINKITVKDKPILKYIIELISNGNEVFLFGFSLGGLFVNRICEEIQNYIINKEKTDEKKGFLNNYKKKLIVATFGSIYLVDKDSLGSINIINYMYINDVAIRMNYHQIKKDGGVPNHADLNKNFICEKGKLWNGELLFRYNKIDKNELVTFLNYYKYNDTPATKTGINYTLNDIDEQFRHHRNYKNNLVKILLENYTNDLSKTNRQCVIYNKDTYDQKGGIRTQNTRIQKYSARKSRKSKKSNKTKKTRK